MVIGIFRNGNGKNIALFDELIQAFNLLAIERSFERIKHGTGTVIRTLAQASQILEFWDIALPQKGFVGSARAFSLIFNHDIAKCGNVFGNMFFLIALRLEVLTQSVRFKQILRIGTPGGLKRESPKGSKLRLSPPASLPRSFGTIILRM